jgi:hypothetical protein
MAHVHHHEDSSYYLEQLWTMATCAALGVVMILLWWYKVLPIFLDPKFHDPVLWGGIALLVLVVVRAAAVWVSVARREVVHGHTHAEDEEDEEEECHHHHGPGCDHGHDHDHDHAHAEHVVPDPLAARAEEAATASVGAPAADSHAGHEHHDHEHHHHGWQPWRYAVLLLPTVLFLMKIPWPQAEEPVEANVIPVKLREAEQSADAQNLREYWEGRMKDNSVRVRGKFAPIGSDRQFSFVKLKMTCCFADAYPEPVKILVESPKRLNVDDYNGQWVRVVGKIDYRKQGEGYVTVVKATRVDRIKTPANQFDN